MTILSATLGHGLTMTCVWKLTIRQKLLRWQLETDYVSNTGNLPSIPSVKSWHKHNGSGGDIVMTHKHARSLTHSLTHINLHLAYNS